MVFEMDEEDEEADVKALELFDDVEDEDEPETADEDEEDDEVE